MEWGVGGRGWWWCSKAENGVVVIVGNWLIGKVEEVERFNGRLTEVDIVIWDIVWEVVSCYCPQASRSVNEKMDFYDLMDKIVRSEKVLVGGDISGHVGSDMGGFGKVYGGFGVWPKMLEGSNCWTEQLVKGGI